MAKTLDCVICGTVCKSSLIAETWGLKEKPVRWRIWTQPYYKTSCWTLETVAVGRKWMPVASSDGGYALLSAAHTA